jgi:hypothetical protein
MKHPQRGQIILQRRGSKRDEQGGQNWLGNSSPGAPPSGCGVSLQHVIPDAAKGFLNDSVHE